MAKFKKVFLIYCLVFLTGCSAKLVSDSIGVSAIDANYPTAEFTACDTVWHGLGQCIIKKGEELNQVGLKIQGYYKGAIKIASTCPNHKTSSFRYTGSSAADIYVPGKAEEDCGLSFIVSPEYPKEEESKLQIHSFEGHLHLIVMEEDDDIERFIIRQKEHILPTHIVEVDVDTEKIMHAEVLLKSDLCNINYEQALPIVDKKVRIALANVMPDPINKICVIQGGVLADKEYYISIFYAGYDHIYAPLDIPFMALTSKGQILFEASREVSAIAFDEEFIMGNKSYFNWDPSGPHIVRLLTVKGRSVIGVYLPDKGGWRWMQ